MKYVVAGLWLLLAVLFRDVPWGRKVFAYGGAVLALVHACALGVGMLGARWNASPAESGPPVGGFLFGIALGLILGLLVGGTVSRSNALYLIAQLVAAGFLMFLPLFRM